jgi:hypothetical protein
LIWSGWSRWWWCGGGVVGSVGIEPTTKGL